MDPAKYAKIKLTSKSVIKEEAPVGDEIGEGGA